MEYRELYSGLLSQLEEYKGWSYYTHGMCIAPTLKGRHWKGDVLFCGRCLNDWDWPLQKQDLQLGRRTETIDRILYTGITESLCHDSKYYCKHCSDPSSCPDPQMHWAQRWEKKTAFWGVVARVVRKLHPEAEMHWASWVAWTNLYKVGRKGAETTKGIQNPSSGLLNLQFGHCKKILEEELSELKPSAVVFITETKKKAIPGNFSSQDSNDWWYGRFFGQKGTPADELEPLLHGRNQYVRIGEIGQNTKTKAIVVLRPEGLSLEPVTDQIVEAVRG